LQLTDIVIPDYNYNRFPMISVFSEAYVQHRVIIAWADPCNTLRADFAAMDKFAEHVLAQVEHQKRHGGEIT